MGYKAGFNSFVLNLFMNFYDLKRNDKYAYCHVVGNTKSYTYSQACVEFIVNEIKKDPDNIVASLKAGLENKKR